MNVLQVNYTDVLGHRFNGGALIPWLQEHGHTARQAVGIKQGAGNSSVPIVAPSLRKVTSACERGVRKLENSIGVHNVLYPQSFLLPFNPAFKTADVVHYHIIHNQFFSYLALPRLTKLKPSVWSLHDPWALTGHCVHPLACEGWRTGCKSCPHLDYPFAIRRDTAWLNFKLKDFSYRNSNMHLVVASRWMQRLVEQSPLMQHFPLHLVSFGLDLKVFTPGNKALAKSKLGLSPGRIVIGLRALEGPYKGLEYALKAIEMLPADLPVHLLTCQRLGAFSSLNGKFPITELGEVEGDNAMVDFFQATDIHLMPSMAESFGMMAMEATACGVPSVVFEGTPLSDVCFAPEGGFAVPRGDARALSQALHRLVDDDELRETMGKKARALAELNYSFEKYAASMLHVYDQARASHETAKP
ncbi:glycosyltransferase [Polaromonas sp. YR568]|uniref:glycosyltransferase n=1 Tax=Polaromonas sp. YR568 TaxID=1855301 RepID=UPI00398C0801